MFDDEYALFDVGRYITPIGDAAPAVRLPRTLTPTLSALSLLGSGSDTACPRNTAHDPVLSPR